MAPRLLLSSGSFRSIASISLPFFNLQPTPLHHQTPISVPPPPPSASPITPNHHQARLVYSFPTFPDYPNTTVTNIFTMEPKNTTAEEKAVTLTSIVHELAHSGRTHEALHAYNKFMSADVIPEPQTCYVLIEALAAAEPSLVEAAEQCVVDMMSRGVRQYHLRESAYLAVYVAFVKQGRLEKAEQFLMEIKGRGLWGSQEEAVRDALEGFSEVGVQKVLNIVMDDSLIKKYEPEDEYTEEYITETSQLVRGCFMHYRAIVMFDALMEDGLTKEAMEVREYILANGEIPPVVIYTESIVAFSGYDTEKVIKVYEHMIVDRITPNSYTYCVLIQALAKDPNFLGEAKKYLLEMLHKGMRPNVGTCSAVIAAFTGAEKFEECSEILKQMQAERFDLNEACGG